MGIARTMPHTVLEVLAHLRIKDAPVQSMEVRVSGEGTTCEITFHVVDHFREGRKPIQTSPFAEVAQESASLWEAES